MILTLIFTLLATGVSADYLTGSTLLHPLDNFTAYTLDKNEWVFNFPLAAPGYLMWGVTDDVTVELDAECWLGGVPSVNARFRLCGQKGALPALAFESMYQYLPNRINLIDDYEYLNIWRQGNSWFNRINMSWALSEKVAMHISPGVTYSEMVEIDNGDRSLFQSSMSEDIVKGDFSAGFSWIATNWLSVHSSVSSGVTFLYLDNVPGKEQLAAGVRINPFTGMSQPILRNMGIDLAILSMSFPEVDETLTGPMFYLFWQWK